jgi:hypothetical protein
MSIKRAPRPESNFYLLNKSISEDQRLSWAARGLLVFLLGKPDHWQVSVAHLIKETQGAYKKSGRDAVYAMLTELEKAGYLARERGRGKAGEFGKVDYIVTETPHTDNPEAVDSPYTGYPDTAEPDTANPTLVSTEGLVSTEELPSTDQNNVAPDDESPVAAGNVVAIRSPDKPRCEIPSDMPGPKDQNAKTFKAWANYAMAYRRRYGVFPIWNQKTAGQMGQLVDRVGKDLAPRVAAYYLGMNNQFYVTKSHPVGLLLSECESIATQMQTGSQMTQTRARQMDSTQSNLSNVDEAKRLLASGWGDD